MRRRGPWGGFGSNRPSDGQRAQAAGPGRRRGAPAALPLLIAWAWAQWAAGVACECGRPGGTHLTGTPDAGDRADGSDGSDARADTPAADDAAPDLPDETPAIDASDAATDRGGDTSDTPSREDAESGLDARSDVAVDGGPDAAPDGADGTCEPYDVTITLDVSSSGTPCTPTLFPAYPLTDRTAAVGDRPSILGQSDGSECFFSTPPEPGSSLDRWMRTLVDRFGAPVAGYVEREILRGTALPSDPGFDFNGYGQLVTAYGSTADPLRPLTVVQFASAGVMWTREVPGSEGAAGTPAVVADEGEDPLLAWICPGPGSGDDRLLLQRLTHGGALDGAPFAYATGDLAWVRQGHGGGLHGLLYGNADVLRLDALTDDDLLLFGATEAAVPDGHTLLDVSTPVWNFREFGFAFTTAAAGELHVWMATWSAYGDASVLVGTPVGPYEPSVGSARPAVAWDRETWSWGIVWSHPDCAGSADGRLRFLRLGWGDLGLVEGPLVPFPLRTLPQRAPDLACNWGRWAFTWVEPDGGVEIPYVAVRSCTD